MKMESDKAVELYWQAVEYYPVSIQPNELLVSLCQVAVQESENHEQWLQQTIAEKIALLQPEQTWIIMQYAIDVNTNPETSHWQVDMQIVEANRFFITRKFAFTQKGFTQPFATCRVRFAAMNYHTRKIVSLPIQRIKAFQSIETDQFKWEKPISISDFYNERCNEFVAIAADVDSNLHVNNLVYIKKGIQQLLEINTNIQVSRLQVFYRNELQMNDHYVILTQTMVSVENYQQWFVNVDTQKTACYIYYQIKEGSDC